MEMMVGDDIVMSCKHHRNSKKAIDSNGDALPHPGEKWIYIMRTWHCTLCDMNMLVKKSHSGSYDLITTVGK